MSYCQSNILYKMVLSIILFAALCDLSPIMHSFKNTLTVAHYKWEEPISDLTFAIFFLHSVFSLFFPLAQPVVEKMLQQTWYHGEMKSGILTCHCPGCSSCHGTYSDQANARISIPAVCDISAGQITSGACCPQNSRLVTTHFVVTPLVPSLKKSCATFSSGQTRIQCAI